MFLQARKLVDVLGRNQVGPRAQDLSEFDERGPQVFQGAAKPAGARFMVIRKIALAQKDAAAPSQIPVQPHLLHDIAKTVL